MATKKNIELYLKKVDPRAVVPSYAHPGEDVGMDVTVIDCKYDRDLDAYIYDTGWACATDALASMFAHPRSSNCKHNFYLTNSVGIIDTKGYRGTVKAVFKHRDALKTRIAIAAMTEWSRLPWYKKLSKTSLDNIKARLSEEFLADPIKYAPYQPGDKAFQIWMAEIKPVQITETTELPKSNRMEGGFGSSDNQQVI